MSSIGSYIPNLISSANAGMEMRVQADLAEFTIYSDRVERSMQLFNRLIEQRAVLKEETSQVITDVQNMLNQLIVVTTLIFGICFETVSPGDFNNDNSLMLEHSVTTAIAVFLCAYAILDSVFLSLKMSEVEARFLGGTYSERIEGMNFKTVDVDSLKDASSSIGLLQLIILITTMLLCWVFQMNTAKNDVWQKNDYLLGWRVILTLVIIVAMLSRIIFAYGLYKRSFFYFKRLFGMEVKKNETLFHVVTRLNRKTSAITCLARNLEQLFQEAEGDINDKVSNLKDLSEELRSTITSDGSSFGGYVSASLAGLWTNYTGQVKQGDFLRAMAALNLKSKINTARKEIESYSDTIYEMDDITPRACALESVYTTGMIKYKKLAL